MVSVIRCLPLLLQEVTPSPEHFRSVTSATKELLHEYRGLIKQDPAAKEPCKLQPAPAPLAIALLPASPAALYWHSKSSEDQQDENQLRETAEATTLSALHSLLLMAAPSIPTATCRALLEAV